jgi:hypothetical protein
VLIGGLIPTLGILARKATAKISAKILIENGRS